MLFGVDVSNHQSYFDFDAARGEGYDFAFIKSTQGDWFVDDRYDQHRTNAQKAGLLVAAYHYQETSSVWTQAQHIMNVVSQDVPVIIDVEDGSGGVDITRELVRILIERGYNVPLVYIPRWYWSRIGSPDLSGLPPLWISRYPDHVVRSKDAALDAAQRLTNWNLFQGHGGLSAEVAQITSTGAVSNYPNGSIDLNVYPGTRDELADLIGSGNEEDMALTQADADLVVDTLLRRQLAMPQLDGGVSGPNIETALNFMDIRAQGTDAVVREYGDRILAGIAAIPAGPSGSVDYKKIQDLVRQVFGDAAAGTP